MINWGSLVSQGTLMYLMASICPNHVVTPANHDYHGQFSVVPSYYSDFVSMVNECFGRSTYYRNVPAQ